MYLFRFPTGDGHAHLGVEDERGARYDLTHLLPNDFGSVSAWLSLPDPVAAAQRALETAHQQRNRDDRCVLERDVPLLAPIDAGQEVWAAGVTYERSKAARMEESREAGTSDVYDRVYVAERPELFFKANGWRVVGTGQPVRIRHDSIWNVPEPELTLVIAASGRIVGLTAGNDLSSRSIEGENPLYLPQAKIYDGACALGPRIRLLSSDRGDGGDPLVDPSDLAISLRVERAREPIFTGTTSTARMRRSAADLCAHLTRALSFPAGAFLMTGTGIVPSDDFTLAPGDIISITIEGIGTLVNPVGE